MSNELGAAHPRTAKFSVLVVVVSAFVVGLLISIILLVFQNQYPSLFTNSEEVKDIVHQLTPLLAFCIVINAIQPALSGDQTPPNPWTTIRANSRFSKNERLVSEFDWLQVWLSEPDGKRWSRMSTLHATTSLGYHWVLY